MVRNNKNLNGYRLFYRVKQEELEAKNITGKDAAAAISRAWKVMHTDKKDSYKYEAAVKRAKAMKEPRPPKPDNYVPVLDKKKKTPVKKPKTTAEKSAPAKKKSMDKKAKAAPVKKSKTPVKKSKASVKKSKKA